MLRNKAVFAVFCFFVFLCAVALAQETFTYDAKGKRNPFIPLVTPDGRLVKLEQEQGGRDLVIQGIIFDKHGVSYAIVNAYVVGVGDSVGDYRVLKILPNKVIFIKDGQAVEIEMTKEE
ncbi:MAG: hypothetical protein NT088_05375 [Candidatus Omnitrophica bacterium]|nr:hypothetical protein [Candidatus Omnitrophota bacterium]